MLLLLLMMIMIIMWLMVTTILLLKTKVTVSWSALQKKAPLTNKLKTLATKTSNKQTNRTK